MAQEPAPGPSAIVPAAPADASALVLTNRQSIYDVSSYLYYTRDGAGDLGAREIYLRHRNNLRGERQPPGPIDLSFDPVPQWLIIDIVNKSSKSDWIFDFGTLADGRYGLAPQIFVQDGQRGTILIDTTSGKAPHGTTLPLSLMPEQRMTLVFYIVPPDHAPLIINPRVVEAAALVSGDAALEEGRLHNIVLVMIAGAAVFFMGCMFLRRGAGFFPHALFFTVQGLWFWMAGGHVYADIPGGQHVTGVAMATGGLLALAVTQSIVAAQDGDASDSLVLYICASFVVLAIMLFIFIVPQNSYMRIAVAGGAAVLAYIVAAVKALTMQKDLRWSGAAAGASWIIMLLAGAMPYLVGFGMLPAAAFFLQAPALAMPLVCVLMVLSGAAYIRAGNIAMVREILRQTQRAQAMNKLKATKETADQARLLRVIEREREIMEDLRAREAERTEEMRMAKITADEANRAKSAFLAVVSHEIRTPMTGIMGMVRLLQDTQMSREQKDYTQTIQDSGDAMLALLNDILDFSKIEGGGMDIESIDFDLHRVVHSVAMLMNGHATQRGIMLTTDIDVDAPRFLKGDPTRLRQVFLNLVGNAIKFTPRGGVTIRLRAGDSAAVPTDKAHLLPIVCSVEDTGIGISEEAQKNLFNPFSQADSSIARKFGGTGLGLAICKRLIEAMGSEIQLTSIEGQGTTFAFTLLLPPGDQKLAEADGRTGELLAGANLAKPMDILVVDDNAVNRKVMEGLLSRDGHRITSAPGGKEALDILASRPFQLVFLDIEMPEMNGFEVMQRILNHPDQRVANTPVVSLTGNVSEEDKERYKQAGMRDTVAKPIDPERLRNILLAHGQAAESRDDMPKKKPANAPVIFELSDDELDEDSFSDSVEYAPFGTARGAAQEGAQIPPPAAETAPAADAQEDPAIAANEAEAAEAQAEAGAPPAGFDGYVPMPPQDLPAPEPEPAPAPQAAGGAIPDTLDDTLFHTATLGSLRTSLSDQQLQEMMDGVFAHNKTVLPTLQTAFNDGDRETLRGCAHELKGMNGNFGLTGIADIAAAIEHAARHGDTPFDQLDEMVFHDLPDAMARTEKIFRGE